MTCDTVREVLLDYLDGVLREAERDAVAAHLAACDACRAEAEALRWADRALAPLAAVQEAPTADPAVLPWLRASRPAWRWAAAAATAAGVLVLALLLSHRPPDRTRQPTGGRREVVTVAPRSTPRPTPRRELAPPQHAARPAPPQLARKPKPRAGAAEEQVSVAIVVVEPAASITSLPPLSSYQAEVALPGGATSALTESISRDETGMPKEITIAYAQQATEVGVRE